MSISFKEEHNQETKAGLCKLISKHLGFSDDNLVLSKFILNLYNRCVSNHSKDIRLQKFESVLKENGGEDFSPEFIKESFDLIYSQIPVNEKGISIKKEMKDESIPGLTMPDKPIKWEEHNSIKGDKKESSPLVRREGSNSNDTSDSQIKFEKDNIYRGYVSNLATYGVFVRLNSPKSFQSGLCHVSQISFDGKKRIQHPSDVLKLNQEVFVKVIQIEKQQQNRNSRFPIREKITLTMRGIDQDTGLDRSEELIEEAENARRPREKSINQENRGIKRRLTSPERWEISQLIASGAVSASDYPELSGYEDPNAAFSEAKIEENNEIEIDIELNKEEPKFLKGKEHGKVDLAPVQVLKNPEGSLGRSAMNGSKLAKEYKEERIKEQKEKEKSERLERSKNNDLLDPLNNNLNPRDSKTQDFISEWKRSQKNISYGKRVNMSMKEQRESLPVYSMRSELVNAVRNNQFLVIVGETGSGKTTQIVQYLYEEGFNLDSIGNSKIIGCTQPRRVAAISVAKRVSEEVDCVLGQEVGYSVRFEDKTNPQTKIKYMTDGMLQREALRDPSMSRYSVIMLDEAHERTIATDILFALLKRATIQNPDLKVIITSATLDSDKFSKYFNNCPIMTIPGRTFPVEVLYTREPEMDYLAAALDSVMQIHLSEPEGDILVFLTGQEEIDTSCEVLFQRMKALGDTAPELIILPVYSALPSEMQSRIFEATPRGSRKVILATNIAETSLTIDGIYYVVDPGFVKINSYDSKLGMDSLVVSPISQAQANQRSGRAGRTGPGKCYRLYTENAYKTEMLPNSIPEIQRQNLAHTILLLKAMGINDLLNFEFMDPPPKGTMINALQDLYILAALDEEGYLTHLGKKMAEFPMEPTLAKTLITSVDFRCTDEILTIIAMLSVQTIFYRPKEKQAIADQKKARFHHSNGDHLTFLNVYKAWNLNGCNKQWCQENFIQERSMRRAQEVRKQFLSIMKRYGYPVPSCHNNLDIIRKVLCAGFFKNSAKRDAQEGYKTIVDQTPVSLHPSSSLFGKNPEYVIFHTMLLTTKEYMHCVTVIDPKWLAELAPNYFKISDPAKINERKKNQKIVPLFDKFAKDKDAWKLSSQNALKKRTLGSR